MEYDTDFRCLLDSMREILNYMPNFERGLPLRHRYIKLMAWFFETMQFWDASPSIGNVEAHYDLLTEVTSDDEEGAVAAADNGEVNIRETFGNILNTHYGNRIDVYANNVF